MSRGRDLIRQMISFNIGENQENFMNFLRSIGYTDQNRTTFWKDLIKDLQADQGKGDGEVVPNPNLENLHHYPIREIDTEIETSLLNIISNLCDLYDEDIESEILISELYKRIRDNNAISFWNESVQELSDRVKELKPEGEYNPTLLYINDNNEIKLNDIKGPGNSYRANAAANYGDTSSTTYVNPFINIDGNSYNDVRGSDQVSQVSKYLDKLDFTNIPSEQINPEWINLIMPSYGRFTKVEDLNRNFWVISEAIDGMSSWLMDGSPLQRVLKNFLNETVQLWENCIYLWMQIALMNQKKSENIFTISEPIKSTDYEHLTTYDNIPKITCKVENNSFIITEEKIYKNMGENDQEKTEEDRLRFYGELYSQSVFGFLPKFRVNNYRHNYYSAEYYKNFYVWNPNKIDENGKFSYELYEIVEENNRPIVISPRYEVENRFSNKIFATRFNEIDRYYYMYPFTKIEQIDYEEPFLLYGCLKVIPEIEFSLNDIKGIDIQKFNLKIYDAAAPIVCGNEREIGRFVFKEVDNENRKIKLEYTPANFEQAEILELQTKTCSEISNSYYLGNVASWKNRIPIKWD